MTTTTSRDTDEMASATTNGFHAPNFILSPHQQDLLFAALNSNRTTAADQQNGDGQTIAPAAFDNNATTSPLQAPGSGSLANLDESPFIDYDYDFDNEASYGEYDFSNLPQGQMIGNLPGTSSDGDAAANESHDKRGLSDDEENDDEPDGKRREGDDKTSKKPGRKPLTSEPTSVRPLLSCPACRWN
jgi:AP-1-like factor